VIFTALLLEQFAPASTVTDELGLADADAEADEPPAEAVLDVPAPGAVELLPPLLQAARPVTAAMAAIPPRASLGRLLVVLVLSLFIGGLLCFLISRGCALSGSARARSRYARR
jgi:hypothetical protein